MKDERTGVVIEEFVGLKPKVYSYLVDDNSEQKKAKGIKIDGGQIMVVDTISHDE